MNYPKQHEFMETVKWEQAFCGYVARTHLLRNGIHYSKQLVRPTEEEANEWLPNLRSAVLTAALNDEAKIKVA